MLRLLTIPACLLLLSACGAKQIDGAVVFPRNGSGDPNAMGSACTVSGRLQNVVTPGKTIRIKNAKGEIIGVTELGEGRQIPGEENEQDRALMNDPAVAEKLAGTVVVGCEFPFKASVKASDLYVVSMDGVTGDLVTTQEELKKEGKLILTVK